MLSSSESAPPPCPSPSCMSFSSARYSPGSSRYLPSSASCALAALFSLFFMRLKERSFPGDIFLAVPALTWWTLKIEHGRKAWGQAKVWNRSIQLEPCHPYHTHTQPSPSP